MDEDTDALLGIRQLRVEKTELDSPSFSSHPSGFDSVSMGRPAECTAVSTLEKSNRFDSPRRGFLERSRQKWARCSKTCNGMRLAKSPSDLVIFRCSRLEDLRFCVDCRKFSDFTKINYFSLSRLTTLWTRSLEPQGSPL